MTAVGLVADIQLNELVAGARYEFRVGIDKTCGRWFEGCGRGPNTLLVYVLPLEGPLAAANVPPSLAVDGQNVPLDRCWITARAYRWVPVASASSRVSRALACRSKCVFRRKWMEPSGPGKR